MMGRQLPPVKRLRDAQCIQGARVGARVDAFNATAAMLRTGIGVGVLPTFIQANNPDSIPVSDPIPEHTAPVWMLAYPDLRQTACVGAFMRHVGDAIAERLQRE